MAEARTKVTPQQKIEMARQALEHLNRGDVSADGFTQDAVSTGFCLEKFAGATPSFRR